ncbi:DUF6691 family protein [Biformimicrobium ophioploci]|uniref:YeeE/YedE family protein n=1 Tax=Biformimicrobium ophioploci TaxID=3036711 RepID=A0ABQ6LZR5_9GAMM|nr:DUF6691 family protein [Microbulbifer sp. NKW57]GMG87563.1 YeeE/YedE family protein [Microbulbifer sp. NKW57]
MKRILCGLLCGTVFGLGLAISGMNEPLNVIGFLDFAGDWNPKLAFVMGGAVAVTLVGYALLKKMEKPLCADSFCEPPSKIIDRNLVGGAALFGIGWGIGGYCPGPAISGLALQPNETVTFVIAMCVGLLLGGLVKKD